MKKNKKILTSAVIAAFCIVVTTKLAVATDVSWGIPKIKPSEIQPDPGAIYEDIIRENDAFYIGDSDEDIVYLTFDCGYENGNLPIILDALKEAQIPALFFLTGHFMESEPDLVLRMVNEGHLVGNHTYDHPNLTTVTKDEFISEITRAEEKFYEITGQEMAKYLRPPEGRFNQEMLDWAEESNYYTILWSLAYVDWHVDKQKGANHALKEVMSRIHPGAIILLHSTSSDNALAMKDLISETINAGYEFRSIEHLVKDDFLDAELQF